MGMSDLGNERLDVTTEVLVNTDQTRTESIAASSSTKTEAGTTSETKPSSDSTSSSDTRSTTPIGENITFMITLSVSSKLLKTQFV